MTALVLGIDAGVSLHGWAILAHVRGGRPRWMAGGHDETGAVAPALTLAEDELRRALARPVWSTIALEIIDPADGWQKERVRSLLQVSECVGDFRGFYRAQGVPVVRASARRWRRHLGLAAGLPQDPQVEQAVRRLVDGVPKKVSGHALDAAGVALAVCLGLREVKVRTARGKRP